MLSSSHQSWLWYQTLPSGDLHSAWNVSREIPTLPVYLSDILASAIGSSQPLSANQHNFIPSTYLFKEKGKGNIKCWTLLLTMLEWIDSLLVKDKRRSGNSQRKMRTLTISLVIKWYFSECVHQAQFFCRKLVSIFPTDFKAFKVTKVGF